MTFTELFVWQPGKRRIAIDFAADEAIQRYWVDHIDQCRCRGN